MYDCFGAFLQSTQSLTGMLAPAALATPRPEMQAAQVGGMGDIWFSVVLLRPSAAKRVVNGSLTVGDIGIAIHKHVACYFEGSVEEVVSSTPINVTPIASAGDEYDEHVARHFD